MTNILQFGGPALLALLAVLAAVAYAQFQKRQRMRMAKRVNQLAREFHGSALSASEIARLDDAEWNGALAEIRGAAGSTVELQASAGLLGRELKRLHTLLDAMGDGLVILDRTNAVLHANTAAAPFLTLPPQESTGKAAKDCIGDARVLSLLNGGSSSSTADLDPDTDAGHAYTTVSCRAASNGTMDSAGHLLVFRDVSKLRDVERLQREFVDSVVHEMRTPLTSIRAYVELLIDGEATDPDAERNFYNIIYEETDRLSQLIDNLLNISMMEGGMIDLNTTPTRIKRVLEEAIDVVRPQCTQKKITLEIDLPDRLPTMDIDKQLFNVAYMNLISNAVKYTPEGGTVHLSTQSHEDELHIMVRDSGIGISEEDQARVFDKFFRAKDAQGEKGSGVGLSTAREIVRLHGGDIRIQSVPGEGSQFTIVVPRSLVNTSIGD